MDYDKLIDMGRAIFYANNIENPPPLLGVSEEDLRRFHIREAREILSGFDEDKAREFLEAVINSY